MLMKSPIPVQPAMSFAYAGNYAVRLAANLRCPFCQRQLHATDVEVVEFGNVHLICRGCHKDVLTIGSAS
jgi:hypothetical protein